MKNGHRYILLLQALWASVMLAACDDGKRHDVPKRDTLDVAVHTASVPVGTRSSVKASSFGWNAYDATECLQAAVDSGAGKIVIDRQAGDWIVRPIFLRRSGQEIVVADCVTVRAKKGEFKGVNDCLFTIPGGVSGLVLRGEGKAVLAMNKKDYHDSDEYPFSEWRNAISIRGGRDITVKDLTILSSGGDGVYVRGAARNVRLENLVCRDHHRQGISVISAVGLRVTNCRFDETSGAAPQCGVDIEPNTSRDRLEDIVFEDCRFDGNAASGIFLHLFALDGGTRSISVTFRRCMASGNRHSGIKINCAGPKGAVRGTIMFEGCEISGNRQHAFAVASKRADALDIKVKDCLFDARGGDAAAVMFDNGNYVADFGGVEFAGNVRVIPGGGKPVSYDGAHGTGIAPGTLKGECTLETGGGARKRMDLGKFSMSYPPQPEVLRSLLEFRTTVPDYRALKVSSGSKRLSVPTSTGWLRKRFTFVQCFPAAGEYPVVFRLEPLGRGRPSAKVAVRDAAGTDLGSFNLEGGVFTNVIRATGAGLRRFEVQVMRGKAAVGSMSPGHALQADMPISLFGGRNRRYHFPVPADAGKVCVEVKPEEPCSARLLRPDGSVAAEMPMGTKMMMLESVRNRTASDEIWSIEFPYLREDATFRIGAPAVPMASPSRSAALCRTAAPEMSVVDTAGVPRFAIDGSPLSATAVMPSPAGKPGAALDVLKSFRAAGVRLASDVWTMHDKRYNPRQWWIDDGVYDFVQFDSIMRGLVDAAPDELVFPRIKIDPPAKWIARNLNEMMDDVSPYPESVAWRKLYRRMLKDMIEHIEKSDYADRVIGYHLGAFSCGEWLTGEWKSPKMRAYIPAVIGDKRDPFPPYSTTLARRRSIGQRGEAVADMLIDAASFVKECTRGTKLIGVFFGYDSIAHAKVSKVLRSGKVDFIAAPPCYTKWRNAGFAGRSQAYCQASFRLHNVVYFEESDFRTFLSEAAFSPKSHTKRRPLGESVEILKRSVGKSLAGGWENWWFLLGGNETFSHPDLMSVIRTGASEAAATLRTSRWRPAEVAVFTAADEYAMVRHNGSELCSRVHRQVLPTCGVPFDSYELADIDNPRLPEYSVYVFPNAFTLMDGMREKIKKVVRRPGKTAIWFSGPGFYNCLDEGSVANVEDMTGVPVVFEPLGGKHLVSRMLVPSGSALCERDGWRSEFIPLWPDAPGLRKALRQAGVHVWLDTDDVVSVGRVCIASSEKSKIFLNDYKAAATQATFPV